MEHKPCPNPNCLTPNPKVRYMRMINKYFVDCIACGVRGPRAIGSTQAVELWNNLTREEIPNE